MATYGEGDPTDNAQDFYDWLQENDDEDLSGLNYTVSLTVLSITHALAADHVCSASQPPGRFDRKFMHDLRRCSKILHFTTWMQLPCSGCVPSSGICPGEQDL